MWVEVGDNALFSREKYGCHVMEVDISQMMVEKCQQMANSEKVEDRVEFKAGGRTGFAF